MQPRIELRLTKKEIVSCKCDRLIALFENQNPSGLRALHQSVALDLPKAFCCRYEQLSFEHPEVRTFAAALANTFPGFSFFARLDSPWVFKQLFFATVPSITITRRDGKALVMLDEAEFQKAFKRERDAAESLARRAGLSQTSTDLFTQHLEAHFDDPRYC